MKLKTHKGTSKRVKVIKKRKGETSNLFKGAVNNSHLKRKQSNNSTHRKKRLSQINKGYAKKIRRLIGSR